MKEMIMQGGAELTWHFAEHSVALQWG